MVKSLVEHAGHLLEPVGVGSLQPPEDEANHGARYDLADHHDAGWEHFGQMSNWHYFRRPEVAGQPREIFTDSASKAAKYRRLIPFVLIVCVVLGVQLNSDIYTRYPSMTLEVIRFLLCCVFMVLLYSLIRIGLRIRQLARC